MSYLLWQRDRADGIASSRVVLRAAEVPLLQRAGQLCDHLQALSDERARQQQQAYAQAHALGLSEGRAEGLALASDESAARLLALTEAAAHDRERLQHDLAALALQVVRKLMGQLDDDLQLLALARNAAAEIVGAPAVVLVLHPSQIDRVRARLAAVAAPCPFELRADADAALDTCRLETEFGSVDASLAGQLDRLAAAWGLPS